MPTSEKRCLQEQDLLPHSRMPLWSGCSLRTCLSRLIIHAVMTLKEFLPGIKVDICAQFEEIPSRYQNHENRTDRRQLENIKPLAMAVTGGEA